MPNSIPQSPNNPLALRRSPRFLPPEPALSLSEPKKKARLKDPPQNNPTTSLSKRRTGSGSEDSGKSAAARRRSPRLSVRSNNREESVVKIETRTRCIVLSLPADGDLKGAREGNKKRRRTTEAAVGSTAGWTKEQQVALERAYLAAKPTPHFWKKVAKLVPGKSAQECFDRVHSDLSTPQPRLRSRAKKMDPSCSEPSPISASKMLKSAEPTVKRTRSGKHRNHQAQKTVRQLLQKQYCAEQNNEADLFSVLEPNVDLSAKWSEPSSMFFTPENLQKSQSFLCKLRERSSSRKKPLSRFHSSSGAATLASPPVLKQVKNPVLHEKYLDRLHSRDARRNMAPAGKCTITQGTKLVESQQTDAVKAAKTALVSDVKHAIDQLRDLQANTGSDSADLHDDDNDFDYDEDGDGEFTCS